MKFKQLDLNLLRVLVALHRSGSVTGAGHLLALSQPATSHLLAKLRESFGDELFLRTSKGLKPTPLCERLAPAIQSQLQALESLLTEEQAFDPATQAMDWRVSLSDLGEMMFLPRLAAVLRQQAPQSTVGGRGIGTKIELDETHQHPGEAADDVVARVHVAADHVDPADGEQQRRTHGPKRQR